MTPVYFSIRGGGDRDTWRAARRRVSDRQARRARAADRDGTEVQQLLPVRSTGNVLGTSQREHWDRSRAGGLPGIVCEAGVVPGLFVVDAVAVLAGEFVDGHRIGVVAPLDGALAGCDEVIVPFRVGCG